jgi:hypothetical protein
MLVLCSAIFFAATIWPKGGRCGEVRTGSGSGMEAEYHRPFGDASHRPHSAR